MGDLLKFQAYDKERELMRYKLRFWMVTLSVVTLSHAVSMFLGHVLRKHISIDVKQEISFF